MTIYNESIKNASEIFKDIIIKISSNNGKAEVSNAELLLYTSIAGKRNLEKFVKMLVENYSTKHLTIEDLKNFNSILSPELTSFLPETFVKLAGFLTDDV